jgi:putative DNA primase/helicase
LHPSGELYEWDRPETEELAKVDGQLLFQQVRELAAASLLLKYYPDGSRHHFAMHLAGALLRAGWDVADVEWFVTTIAEEAGDDEIKDRMRAVEDTWKKLEQDEPASGFQKLNLSLEERCTDKGNAEAFIEYAGGSLRYISERKHWAIWSGKHWKTGTNANGYVRTLAMEYAGTIFDEAKQSVNDARTKLGKHAVYSNSNQGINSFVSLASDVRGVRASVDQFDRDQDSLNVLNGTIDLRTGELRTHTRDEHHSKLAPVIYDPNATCERWERFLLEIFGGDKDLVRYMQRVIGYTLTGRTREEVFFLLWGDGRNGKGTMVETLQAMLGDYADTIAPEALMLKNESGGNTPELAKLKGIRFAPSSETEAKRKLAEALVKRITGGDSLSVCAKYENPFTYKPEFKLWLATNKKPTVSGTDLGIWSRIKMIPFTAKFEGESVDKTLKETLRNEMSGILAWCVRGSIEWYQHQLGTCAVVEAATNQYKEESNSIARFIDDCCDTDNSELTISSSALFDAYKRYCNENRLDAENIKTFKTALESRGFTVKRTKAGVIWTGIDLADTFDSFAEFKTETPIPVDDNWREPTALAA